MSESNSDRAVHWYYRLEGKDQGPVLLSRLRQMAHRGTLTCDDLVRKGKTGEWVRAGSFAEIDSHAAELSDQAKIEPQKQALNIPDVPKQNRLKDFVDSISERFSDFLSDARWAVVSRTRLLRAVVGYLALAVVVVSLISVSINPKRFDWKSPENPYTACRSLWDELKEMRASEASDTSWQEFTERGRNELLPIVARLEREASSSNRSAQLLLWASRDCLPKMFLDARSAPSSSEKLLADYLENVEHLRAGKPIYGGNSQSHIHLFGQSRTSFVGWFKEDPITVILGVILTAANFVFVGWFVKGLFFHKTVNSNS